MGMYYNLFALGQQLDPVVSVPYVDAFGTGRLYSSNCSQLFHFPKFQEVEGVENSEKEFQQL